MPDGSIATAQQPQGSAPAQATDDKAAMETTGFQDAEISFCLEVLLELPDVAEVVDEKNQRRLDELEKAGII